MLPVRLDDLKALIEENRDLVVKIGHNYEISRPLALKLWQYLVSKVVEMGGSIKESVKVDFASTEMVIVSISCTVEIGESEITLCEIGEAHRSEGKTDTMARTAYTRAMKRLLERLVGEDFINQVINRLFPDVREVPASEKQKRLIVSLVREGKITAEMVREVLGEGASLNQALKENTLTFSQAKALIDMALGRTSNGQAN
jgi:DNA-binding transcriptional ArsR family regulator